NPFGYADGSLDATQFTWLENRLIEASARYYDANGNPIDTGNPNRLIVLFSHHNLQTLDNPIVSQAHPQLRVLSAEIIALLRRFPNVVLWCNGHSHFCRVWAHPDPSGRTGGFWEVNTPSHVDFPQQSRIVEVVDNRDGTLSIFATLVDHLAPPETDPARMDPLGLASISRELSANDNFVSRAVQLGQDTDRNVELLIKAPF
ncbi:MAG: TIGR03767 family metallophosphoesterase, partial [Candidatus Eremiobacterota bacterium]